MTGLLDSSPAASTGRVLLDAIRTGELPPPPAAELLRLDLEVVGDGLTVFGFDADPAYGNPGNVHGGILSAVADFAVTTAVWTQVDAGADIVTADLHVSFLRGISLDGARYQCTGSVLHLGRTQANATAAITSADGVLHVHALATCRIRG
ncbi:PaaI family thioesterase [Actinospongicola halichondriae]|uniref:PaaI family thioesterase n=1 Tax=Actinospongicola halichondriae TaxID=3236844 RepID=UPI003D3A5793